MKEKINLWMPLSKSIDDSFVGILSDTSIDRDNEFMSKELLKKWSQKSASLPMLANHENKMEKLIGGWTNLNVVEKGNSSALTATPFFLESNPLGKQAKLMVKEALDKGLGIGISIGAIPHGEMTEKEVDGIKYKGYTDAEILEATIVPLQSNRNASFSAMAKSFDINLAEKSQETSNTEANTMTEEIKKDVPEVAKEEPEAKKEEPKEEPKTKEEEKVEEKPKEEKAEEEATEEKKPEEDKPEEKPQEVIDALKAKVAELEKQLEEMGKKSINLPNVEGPITEKEVTHNEPLTVEKMLNLKYGGQ